jgi:hypothetical protein
LAREEPSTTEPVLGPAADAGAEVPANGHAPAGEPAPVGQVSNLPPEPGQMPEPLPHETAQDRQMESLSGTNPSLALQACEEPGDAHKPEAQAKETSFRTGSENLPHEPELAPEAPPSEAPEGRPREPSRTDGLPDLARLAEPTPAEITPETPPAEAPPLPIAVPMAVPAAAPVAMLVAAPTALPPPQLVPLPFLEERIRRLEEALARLQEVRAREARGEAPPAGAIRSDPPAATPASGHGLLHEVGKRMFGSAESDPLTPNPSPPRGEGRKAGRRWLLWETIAEARAIVRMIVDPRYRLSWSGRVVPLVLLALIATSWWWVPGTSFFLFGSLLNKAVDLVLAFVLFKVLGQEARRYRETSPDLPPHLRL